jgi:GDP-L-fucose synthase
LSKKKVIPLEIYGSGKAVRQFLYSDDLARVILKFIDLEIDKNEISIVVSPPETSCISIENLIKLLCNTFDFTGTIKYNVTYTDGQLKKTTDNSELVQYLPDFQFTPFKTGIKNTIEFFVTNYNTIRK